VSADEAALVVHDLDQAKAALAAASGLGIAVVLVTAPGAVRHGGPAYLKALVDRAGEGFPSAEWSALIDCGDRAGDVLAALDAGWRRLAFHGSGEAAARLAEIAEARGARLEPLPLARLDLSREADPRLASRNWLKGPRVAAPGPVC
jgi:hypothetical protein